MDAYNYQGEHIDLESVIIDDIYLTLIKKHVAWPVDLTECNKIQLIGHLISHYENLEDYKKCDNLQKVLSKITK